VDPDQELRLLVAIAKPLQPDPRASINKLELHQRTLEAVVVSRLLESLLVFKSSNLILIIFSMSLEEQMINA